MKSLRLVVCGLVALVVGTVTFAGVRQTGLVEAAMPVGPLYSNLVIYPAVMLMGCFGFWIVFSATDPGSEK